MYLPDFTAFERLAAEYQLVPVYRRLVSVGILGGQYLDERFGSEPLMALLGMLFGLAASARALLREVRKMRAEVAADDTSEGQSGSGGSEEEKSED